MVVINNFQQYPLPQPTISACDDECGGNAAIVLQIDFPYYHCDTENIRFNIFYETYYDSPNDGGSIQAYSRNVIEFYNLHRNTLYVFMVQAFNMVTGEWSPISLPCCLQTNP